MRFPDNARPSGQGASARTVHQNHTRLWTISEARALARLVEIVTTKRIAARLGVRS